MRRLTALSAAALLGLSAAPALAGHGTDEPVFVEQAVYFHDGGAKAGNLALVDEGLNPLTFDTTAPARSVTGGAGGGQYADPATEIVLGDHNTASGPTFTGTFTGDIDTVDVDAYAVPLTRAATGRQLRVRAQLTVDGLPLYSDATATAVETVAGGQAASLGRWRYTGVHRLMQSFGMQTGEDVEHEVSLSLLVYFVGDDTVFLYDTSEVPSGMVFNDDAPAGTRTVFPLS